jgi:hypothetical protein
MTKTDTIREYLALNPEATDRQVAKDLGVHRKTVWSVRKSMNGDQPTKLDTDVDPATGKWWVSVNGRVWRFGLSAEEATAELEFLRWPKVPA